ncbi:MAG: DnaJ domain-containing protein, partial [Planctomycetes bacterium]|nr:DnaJ domain-containing protein [Planctomycetota bacterium]
MTDKEYTDYYEILGVEPQDSIKIVRNAYLQLVQQHQDTGDNSPESQAKMKAIEEAYEVLVNPEKRVGYASPGTLYNQDSEEYPDNAPLTQARSSLRRISTSRLPSRKKKTAEPKALNLRVLLYGFVGL